MNRELIRYHKRLSPVSFEGRKLPHHTLLLSHAGTMPRVSKETSEWFWRFTIAVGGRSDSARTVRRHARALLQILETRGVEAINATRICKKLYDTGVVFSDWIVALHQMIRDSRGKSRCTWEVRAYRIPRSAIRRAHRPSRALRSEVPSGTKMIVVGNSGRNWARMERTG